jgi:geranylgeranyl pyrophosphate synthase
MPQAAAVEMIHAYSLIHDDLPAMDNDDLRRGKPTCHIAFGEATAMLAGDALQALAFEVLAGRHSAPTGLRSVHVEMLRVLASACGSHGMAGGQAFDLDAVGRSSSIGSRTRTHARTQDRRPDPRIGASGRARCRRPATPLRIGALLRYGHAVGLAFQIRDDILDIEGDTEVIGKPQGSDAARRTSRPTPPSSASMHHAHSPNTCAAEAIAALAIFDDHAEHLRDLAHYAVDRVS